MGVTASWYRVYFYTPEINPVPTSSNPHPLLPQPLETINLFSVSMNLSTLEISPKWNHTIYVASCACLLSLSIMFSVFIHVVVCNSTSLLFMAE